MALTTCTRYKIVKRSAHPVRAKLPTCLFFYSKLALQLKSEHLETYEDEIAGSQLTMFGKLKLVASRFCYRVAKRERTIVWPGPAISQAYFSIHNSFFKSVQFELIDNAFELFFFLGKEITLCVFCVRQRRVQGEVLEGIWLTATLSRTGFCTCFCIRAKC